MPAWGHGVVSGKSGTASGRGGCPRGQTNALRGAGRHVTWLASASGARRTRAGGPTEAALRSNSSFLGHTDLRPGAKWGIRGMARPVTLGGSLELFGNPRILEPMGSPTTQDQPHRAILPLAQMPTPSCMGADQSRLLRHLSGPDSGHPDAVLAVEHNGRHTGLARSDLSSATSPGEASRTTGPIPTAVNRSGRRSACHMGQSRQACGSLSHDAKDPIT